MARERQERERKREGRRERRGEGLRGGVSERVISSSMMNASPIIMIIIGERGEMARRRRDA